MIQIRHTDELRRGDVVVEEATPFTLPQVEREHESKLGKQIREWEPEGRLLDDERAALMALASQADLLISLLRITRQNQERETARADALRGHLEQARAAIREARREARLREIQKELEA